MKIFTLHKPLPPHNKTAGDAFIKSDVPAVCILPDTTLLKDGRPFFIPDFAMPCVLHAHWVVRISRLGRGIPARFAHRYYDAVTVGVTFLSAPLLDEARRDGLPWDLATGFDGAAAIGTFVELDGRTPDDFPLEVAVGTKARLTGSPDGLARHVDEQIARISRFCTLRHGDLLFAEPPAPGCTVEIDDRVTGGLDGRSLLGFNVK